MADILKISKYSRLRLIQTSDVERSWQIIPEKIIFDTDDVSYEVTV